MTELVDYEIFYQINVFDTQIYQINEKYQFLNQIKSLIERQLKSFLQQIKNVPEKRNEKN